MTIREIAEVAVAHAAEQRPEVYFHINHSALVDRMVLASRRAASKAELHAILVDVMEGCEAPYVADGWDGVPFAA